jgi:hypothetical protein
MLSHGVLLWKKPVTFGGYPPPNPDRLTGGAQRLGQGTDIRKKAKLVSRSCGNTSRREIVIFQCTYLSYQGMHDGRRLYADDAIENDCRG